MVVSLLPDSIPLPQCHLEGHFGSSGIYDRLEEVALKYAFLLHALSACPDSGHGAQGGGLDHAFLAAVALGILVLLGGEMLHDHMLRFLRFQ